MGKEGFTPVSLSHCLNQNISSHHILSSEWDVNYELPWFPGKYRSCSRSGRGERFISKGVKVPPQKRVRPKASTTHLQVLTQKEADDVLILSGEKSTPQNGVNNSDPVLVTSINKLIYLLYVLFPSLSSLIPPFLPACCPSGFLYSKSLFESLHFPPLNVPLPLNVVSLVKWISEKHPGKINWLSFIVFSQAVWAQALLISKFV